MGLYLNINIPHFGLFHVYQLVLQPSLGVYRFEYNWEKFLSNGLLAMDSYVYFTLVSIAVCAS